MLLSPIKFPEIAMWSMQSDIFLVNRDIPFFSKAAFNVSLPKFVK